jgi:hypothetical protein
MNLVINPHNQKNIDVIFSIMAKLLSIIKEKFKVAGKNDRP